MCSKIVLKIIRKIYRKSIHSTGYRVAVFSHFFTKLMCNVICVSINKQLNSFQICLDHVSQLCQRNAWKTHCHFRRLLTNTTLCHEAHFWRLAVRYDIYIYVIRQLKFNYILTSWSTFLLEKLTDSKPVNKFLAFYGTRRFITTFTNTRLLSLSWASSTPSTPPHSTS